MHKQNKSGEREKREGEREGVRTPHQIRDIISPGAVHDAVQAVGNGKDSAVWKLFADSGLNQVVCFQINCCCGLIQD